MNKTEIYRLKYLLKIDNSGTRLWFYEILIKEYNHLECVEKLGNERLH